MPLKTRHGGTLPVTITGETSEKNVLEVSVSRLGIDPIGIAPKDNASKLHGGPSEGFRHEGRACPTPKPKSVTKGR